MDADHGRDCIKCTFYQMELQLVVDSPERWPSVLSRYLIEAVEALEWEQQLRLLKSAPKAFHRRGALHYSSRDQSC